MSSTIKAIGIDTVAVQRFVHWYEYSTKQLQKIFSTEEIEYAFSNPTFFAQRLAVRFAAKEAFFKALQQIMPDKRLSLLQIAKVVSVTKEKSGKPMLVANWETLLNNSIEYKTLLSLSHESCHSTAIVLLMKN